jgi:hypothetical protein
MENAKKIKELKANSASIDAFLQSRDTIFSDSLDPKVVKKEFEEMDKLYDGYKAGKTEKNVEKKANDEDEDADDDAEDDDNEDEEEDSDGENKEESKDAEGKDGKTEKDKNDDEEDDTDSEDDFDWIEESDEKDVFWVFYTDEELRYRAGEQVFNNYGNRSNHFLMLWYGFALKKNRYDSLNFSVRP